MKKTKKHFYSDLINSEPLLYELSGLDLEEDERQEIENMIDDNLHHVILESILDELSEDDKQIFLQHIAHNAHDKVFEHLRSRIQNIEAKIKGTADTMMEELYKDIKAVKEEETADSLK